MRLSALQSPTRCTDFPSIHHLYVRTDTTALAGKWGLGNFGTTGYPDAQGFDHFIGLDLQMSGWD